MNKAIKILGTVAGMASLLVSCQKEKLADNTQASGMVEYSVIAEYSQETKTALAYDPDGENKDGSIGKYYYKWNSGDKLAVSEFYLKGNTYNVVTSESKEGEAYGEGNERMKFSVNFTPKGADSYTYYSVYPFKALKKASVNATEGKIAMSVELPEVQNPLADSFDPSADILVSLPYKGKPNGGFDFTFNRHSVGVKLNVKNFATEYNGKTIIFDATDETDDVKRERIEKVTITSSDSYISGIASFSFGYGDLPPTKITRSGTSKEISLDYSSIVDDDLNIGMDIDNVKGSDIYFTA